MSQIEITFFFQSILKDYYYLTPTLIDFGNITLEKFTMNFS